MACYDNDKYSKIQVQNSIQQRPFEVISLRSLTKKDAAVFVGSPFHLYFIFLMISGGVYYALGGTLLQTRILDQLGMLSTVAETIGLLVLRQKIRQQRSVAGISGVAIAMYCLTYTLRQVMLMPPPTLLALGGWAVEVLQVPSILIVFDVLRSIFVTQRRSYQEELDCVKMKHLVPGCVLLAMLVSPQFPRGPLFSFFQGVYIYLDTVALLPQVVLMARGGVKISAPIAHFVAATAIRELVDLWFWVLDFDLGPQGYYGSFNYSGWICLISQSFAVLLVADFMYYYFKARMLGIGLSDDLALPELIDV